MVPQQYILGKENKKLLGEINMSKKLKLAFWLTDKTLAMKVVEQTGLPRLKETGFVRIKASPYLEDWGIYLRGNYWAADNQVVSKCFNSNEERDEYLQKMVSLITQELFSSNKELKIGEVCAISDDPQFLNCYTGKLLAILPKGLKNRYIIKSDWDTDGWTCGEYIRMLNRTGIPTNEECGNVVTYTWEEK